MTFDPKQYLTNLRGKQYLEVKWRVLWFRTVHPKGAIDTDYITGLDFPVVKATIRNEDGSVLATGYGTAKNDGGKKVVWSGKEIEKAETAAIGRALAHAGFGTQFTAEDESDNVVDSPVSQPTMQQKPNPQRRVPPQQLTMSREDFVAGMFGIGVDKEEISDFLQEIGVEGGTDYARIWKDVQAYRAKDAA